MRQVSSYIILLIVLAACIDQVELSVGTEEPHLVVEGQITNEAPPYTIRLTYTGKYGYSGQNPDQQYVQGAQVKLTDDQGGSTQFVSVGLGVYQTVDSTFRGQIGRAYSVSVILSDGKRYVSKPERMPNVPQIDSLSASLIQTGNQSTPYAMAYSVYTHDPGEEKNFYRWTGYGYTNRLSVGKWCDSSRVSRCNNRCWSPVSNSAVQVYSDEAVNGNLIIGRDILQVPIYTIGPQLIEVQQYSVTQANYQFLLLYQQQNIRTGSIFDPLPGPITGNLVKATDPADRARGYFAVTSLTRKRIRNHTYNAPFYGALTSYLSSLDLPPGDCRNTYGQVPIVEPDGW